MTQIKDVLTKYFHGLDGKILDEVTGVTDEVFSSKELAEICDVTTVKASEAARWLSRANNEVSMVKIRNMTYYGTTETISKLTEAVAGTRIIRKKEVK